MYGVVAYTDGTGVGQISGGGRCPGVQCPVAARRARNARYRHCYQRRGAAASARNR